MKKRSPKQEQALRKKIRSIIKEEIDKFGNDGIPDISQSLQEDESPKINIKDVLDGYLEALVYVSDSEIKEQLEAMEINQDSIDIEVDSIDINSVKQAKSDVDKFMKQAKSAQDELDSYNGDGSMIGYKFALSRMGHGVGFFDEYNDKLQDISRKAGSVYVYVGDDHSLYIGKG